MLGRAVNTRVTVRLKSGDEYTGILEKCDPNMNLIIVDAEELNNGTVIAKYGRIFIRGNNILYIKLDSTQVLWV
ncbi:MAG: ribonucleoprotein [archaeon YNP-LCB-003-016]|uniref:LSM domain-containing protein n=1 Tax=Candidatus Culexarchaeum yellowstonense TaxID=2928963 RepID=UPI0029DB955A|nr:ribonucleoprotein [Candidatus Verstraetearchaeota archaeon]MCR6668864.1 ribonucleoprotein [Candidatus Culexarchaeum yellowstonense]MCR6691636.1 ribonucleoprotein [Candidatus Culexarchaeum yellowstonense]